MLKPRNQRDRGGDSKNGARPRHKSGVLRTAALKPKHRSTSVRTVALKPKHRVSSQT